MHVAWPCFNLSDLPCSSSPSYPQLRTASWIHATSLGIQSHDIPHYAYIMT